MTLLTIVRFDSGSIQVEETTIRKNDDWQLVLAETIDYFATDRHVVEVSAFRLVSLTGQILQQF